jgi:8-oxo-dGTP pyrophosphatase MutT (NUDIX family)
MPVHKRKVFAYITRADRLLVFSQPNAPEAGIQVPAGTVEDGESFDAAVMREAFEETGLLGLRLIRLLGEQVRDMADVGKDEVHHRHFYHLRYDGNAPSTWGHLEPDPDHGGDVEPSAFFWARLPNEVPPLIADHGAMLPHLIACGDTGKANRVDDDEC